MDSSRQHRAAFSLVELLVTISIIAILACLLFPSFTIVRSQVRRTQCLSNLRQVGCAFHVYAEDNDGFIARCGQWDGNSSGVGVGSVLPYVDAQNRGTGVIRGCPEYNLANYGGQQFSYTGYTYNPFLDFERQVAQHNYFNSGGATWMGYAPKDWARVVINNQGNRLLIADGGDFYVGNSFGNNLSARHMATFKANRVMQRGGTANVLFVDAHVGPLSQADGCIAVQNPAALP